MTRAVRSTSAFYAHQTVSIVSCAEGVEIEVAVVANVHEIEIRGKGASEQLIWARLPEPPFFSEFRPLD